MAKRKKEKQRKTLTGLAKSSTSPKSKSRHVQQSEASAYFSETDNILLVGEGDFSFAVSLLNHHACTALTATSNDDRDVSLEKYRMAEGNTDTLLAEDMTILFGVDARKLDKAPGVRKNKGSGYDRIVFNFPHVGGITKDVNRQVRYNQELLVDFFKSSIPLLSRDGSIVVTLFEGEPYALWNIRDLARHSGLKVGRSFQFRSENYPGYRHARTLGDINSSEAWKGENRPARTYLFQRSGDDGESVSLPMATSNSKKRKRLGQEGDSESD